MEEVVDFSVPVKHGLSLEVRRNYSDSVTTDENTRGEESLGYNNNIVWSGRNWRLGLYESRIQKAKEDSSNNSTDNTLVYFDEKGRFFHFGYFKTENYNAATHSQLRLPWDTSTYNSVSIFKLRGTKLVRQETDPEFAAAQTFNSTFGGFPYFRQTAEDLTIYVLHANNPTAGHPLSDDQNISYYVLRNNITGQQYHYFGEIHNYVPNDPNQTEIYLNPFGRLFCYDLNWRNNVPQGANGHVDDYLKITWRNCYTRDGNGNKVNGIDRVYAPPSDGRVLEFVHDGDFSNVVKVNLLSPNTQCPSTTVVNYQYVTATTPARGRLYRAWRGNNNMAVQYDYGDTNSQIDFSTSPPSIILSGQSSPFYLVMVSDYNRATGVVNAHYVNQRDRNYLSNHGDLVQYVCDPENNGEWRKAFRVEHSTKTQRYLDGAKSNDSGQYGGENPEQTNTVVDFNFHHLLKSTSIQYCNATALVQQNFPPPQIQMEYMAACSTDTQQNSNLLSQEWILVGTDRTNAKHWIVDKTITYVDAVITDLGRPMSPSGIAKVKTVKLYPDWVVTNGAYSQYESTAQTTTFEYGPGDTDDQISAIVYPDSHREEFVYDSADRLTQHTVKNIGGSVKETIEYFYRTTDRLQRDGVVISPTDVNYGLLDKIRVTPYGKASRETTYLYTDGTDKYPNGSVRPKGMIKSVTIEGRTTSYTYDDFGNVTSVTTPEGTSTYTYSGKNEDGSNKSDATLPPRLLTAKDPLNATTTYQYDANSGRVSTVTTPNGKTSQYTYDLLGNVSKVVTSGMDAIVTKYDIYGRLMESRVDSGSISKSCTRYSYDAFGRLLTEKVMKVNGTTNPTVPLYTVNYAYAHGIGTAAGERDKVAMREITDDPNSKPFDRASFTSGYTHEFTYYKYNTLGMPVSYGQATTDNFLDILTAMHWGELDGVNDDVRYSYDSAGRLTRQTCRSGSSSALWGCGYLDYKYDSLGRLWREVYPDGRYNEYSYDQAGWLTNVKDPFGFINKPQYLSDGRLSTHYHSKLGVATYTYDPDAAQKDLVTRLALGNNALNVAYTYDAMNRLNGFTYAKTADGTVLMDQDWSYSNTSGLKNATNITAANLGTAAGDTLATAYDTASGRRLASETMKLGGVTRWTQTYGYDNSENRTSLNLSGTAYTFGYNASGSGQNRETSLSPGGTPLGYDFKGNTTSRTPLAGGNPYIYSWNAYDRLTRSTRSGGATVDYLYDPQGRLLRRAKSGGDTTVDYWLGGCQVAEAEWGNESGKSYVVVRPDASEAGAPTANGWGKVTGTPTLAYETDAYRGTVLHLSVATTGQYDLNVMNGDYGNADYNPNDAPFNETLRRHIGFWVKNNKANQAFRILVTVKGASGTYYRMTYTTDAGTDSYSGGVFSCHLGTRFNNGGWHYVEVDTAAPFAQFASALQNDTIAALNGIAFQGNDLTLDDLVISGTALTRCWQVVPGAAIGGALGGYTLAGLSEDRWFNLFNELGTVVGTAYVTGNPRSLSVPDYFGNYRTAGSWGTRPDTMGLTGKLLDADSGLYDFGARWFDPERGRWMSEEPLGLDGPNPYQFCFNTPANGVDPNGLLFGGLVNAGEGYGRSAVEYYADITTSRCSSGWAKAGAYVGGFLSALWTPETSDKTATTLMTGWAIGGAVTAPGFLANPLRYELGQLTVRDEVFIAFKDLSPVERGYCFLVNAGKGSFIRAMRVLSYPKNFYKTIFTGLSPAARIGVAALFGQAEYTFNNLNDN